MITEILINGKSASIPKGIDTQILTVTGLFALPSNARLEIETETMEGIKGRFITVELFSGLRRVIGWKHSKAAVIYEFITKSKE